MRVSSCHIRRSIIILAFSPRSARGSSSASFVLRFNLTEKFESPSLLAKSATGKLKLIFDDISKFLSGSNQSRAFGSNGENGLFKFLNYKTFLRCLIFLIFFV